MSATDEGAGPPPDAAEILARLEELDRVLPRSIEEWVAAREREGLDVPAVLKKRLEDKARLRAEYRAATEGGA